MRRRHLGRLALGALAGLALLAFFFKGVDAEALAGTFRSARPGPMALVVIASIVTFAIRAWRWSHLLRPVARVPYWRLFSVTFIAFMAALVVPRAGEVVRPYLVARDHKLPFTAAFASIILERLIDLMTVLLLFGAYLYLLPAPAAQVAGPWMRVLKVGGAITAASALALGALMLAFHVHSARTLAWLQSLLGRLPERLAHAASRALEGFAAGLGVLKASPRQLAVIALQSLLLWQAIALSVHYSYRAFDVPLPYHASFVVMTFLTVGVAIPTPGMVGGFHEAYRLALTQVFGIAPEVAVAGGIAMHFLTQLPVLVIGLVMLAREGLTFGKVAELTERAGGPDAGDAARAPVSVEPRV